MAYAGAEEQNLSIQTSPRTPDEAVAALERAIRPPHRLGIFGSGENRYKDVLAEASEIVVTSDSVSMLSDALASGKPVSVYPLPQSRNLKWRAGEWLYRNAVEAPSPLFAPVRWLFEAGVIEAAADRRRLIAAARGRKAAGLVRRGSGCRRSPRPCAVTSRRPSSLCVH